MVYTKDDGSFGFSWQKQYDFLLRESPDELENIVQSKFSLFKEIHSDFAEYIEGLRCELSERISNAWDNNPNFGWADSNEVVKAFIKDKNLEKLFSDVPALLEPNLSFEDDDKFSDWLTEL